MPNSRRRPLRGRSCFRLSNKKKRLIILPSKRRPLRGPSWDLCFPIFQKRLIILPSKRRPLRQKSGGGHSCCSDPQLLQNSRRRLVGICGSRFSKKDSLFCLQKGGRQNSGGHSCCSDPNCPFFIYAKASRPKSRKRYRTFLFFGPQNQLKREKNPIERFSYI